MRGPAEEGVWWGGGGRTDKGIMGGARQFCGQGGVGEPLLPLGLGPYNHR